ncbi:MAG: hypothetical protein ACR5K9_04850 [Wolbachia sp.]
MAQIKLKKLTGIQVGTEVINASGDFKTKVEALGNSKLVFAGQDYKGTL